ncbi:MAG: nucleotidyltransferase domain-containing protein [Gammaproteobacteria bacterium]|nr:nucleotidyltransferase domain-containing protein [Gammaproteobacteria bacterium]
MGISVEESAQNDSTSAVALADALFTKVQQRVLGLLFGNPERSFYANEIIALAQSGTGAVQRELARLQSSGLVTVQQIGRQKHYQANRASPVFEELRGLVMKTVGLADVLRAALAPLRDRIVAAFVFGSVAKGQDSAASDIDLMVVSDALSYADLFAALEPAVESLGRPVNPTVYTRAELKRRIDEDNAFIGRVLAQNKIWVIGSIDDIESG